MYADKRKFFRRNRPKISDNTSKAMSSTPTTVVLERKSDDNAATSSSVAADEEHVNREEHNADDSFTFTASERILQNNFAANSSSNASSMPQTAADSLLDVEMSELDSLPIDDDDSVVGEPRGTNNSACAKDDDVGMTFSLNATTQALLVPSPNALQQKLLDNNSTSAELQRRSLSPEKHSTGIESHHNNSHDAAGSSATSAVHDHQQQFEHSSSAYHSQKNTTSGAAPVMSGGDNSGSSVTGSSTPSASSSSAAVAETANSSAAVSNFAVCTNRRRVKLYALNAERHWDDKGTGHVIVTVHNTPPETEAGIEPTLSLLVRDENDGTELLSSRVRLDTSYQRQQETLIVWSEKGSDLALSFQERIGCEDVWAKICEIQGKDPSVEVTQECVDDDDEDLGLLGGDGVGGGGMGGCGGSNVSASGMGNVGGSGSSGMMSSVSAPLAMRPPTIGNLEAIQKTIKQCMQLPVERERLSIALEQDNYLSRLLDLFRQCEDVDDLHSMYCLYHIVFNILMLNKNALYERVFSEENIDAVLGALEYDPKICTVSGADARKQHRHIVHVDARFREIVPIPNADIRSKIIQTYKVQYIHDIILPTPTVFEDNMLSALSSFLFFNKVEITSQLQEDEVFLQALIDAVLVDDDDDENKNESSRAQILKRRRDVFAFWKEYCAFSHTLQAGNRDMFYRAMIDQGILKAIEVTIRTCKDTETRSLVLEVFSYLIEFGPQAMIRDYCLSQVQMGSQSMSTQPLSSSQPRPLSFGGSSNFSQRSPSTSQPALRAGISQQHAHSAATISSNAAAEAASKAATTLDANDFDERSLFLNVIIRELICGGSADGDSSSGDADSNVDINIVIQLMSVLRVLLDPENMTANMSIGGGGGGGQQSANPKTEFLAFFYRHCIQHLLEPLMKHTESPKHRATANSSGSAVVADKTLANVDRVAKLAPSLNSRSLPILKANDSDLFSKKSDPISDDEDAEKAESEKEKQIMLENDAEPSRNAHKRPAEQNPSDIVDTPASAGGEAEDDDDLSAFAKNKKLRTSPKISELGSPAAADETKLVVVDAARDASKSVIAAASYNVDNQQNLTLLRRRMLPLHELLRERSIQATARLNNGIASPVADDVSPRQNQQPQRDLSTIQRSATNSNPASSSGSANASPRSNLFNNYQLKGAQQQSVANQKRQRPNNTATAAELAVSVPVQQYYAVAPHLLTAQLLNQIVELISFCIDHHTFYIKNYVIGKNLLGRVLVLMRSPHMFLVCTALRALRKIVGLNNEFYNRYIQRNDLLRSVVERFLSNGTRYNLFNSAVLELFEHIRADDNETLGTYVLERYWDKLKDITYIKTFQELKKKFEKQRFGRGSGPVAGGGGVGGGGLGLNDSDEEELEEEDELEDDRAGGVGGEELDEDDDDEEEDEEEDEEIDENYDDDGDDDDDGTVVTHLGSGGGFGLGSAPISQQRPFGRVHRHRHPLSIRHIVRPSRRMIESGVPHTSGHKASDGNRSNAPVLSSGNSGRNSGASAVRHHHHHHHHHQQQSQQQRSLASGSKQLTRQLSRDDDDDDDDDKDEDEGKDTATVGVGIQLTGTAARSSVLARGTNAAVASNMSAANVKLLDGDVDADEKKPADMLSNATSSANITVKTENNDDKKAADQKFSPIPKHHAADDETAEADLSLPSRLSAAVVPSVAVSDAAQNSSSSISIAEGANNPAAAGLGHRTFFPLSPMAAALAATAAAAAVEHHQRQQAHHSSSAADDNVDKSTNGDNSADLLATATSSGSAALSSGSSSPSSPTTSILTALANVINTQIDAVSGPVVGTLHAGNSDSATLPLHEESQQSEPNNKLRLTFRRLVPRNAVNKSATPANTDSKASLAPTVPYSAVNGNSRRARDEQELDANATSPGSATAALAFAEGREEQRSEKNARNKRSSLLRPKMHFKSQAALSSSSSSPLDLRRRRDGDDGDFSDDEEKEPSGKKFLKLYHSNEVYCEVSRHRDVSPTPVTDTDVKTAANLIKHDDREVEAGLTIASSDSQKHFTPDTAADNDAGSHTASDSANAS